MIVPIVVRDHVDGERFGNKLFQYALGRKLAVAMNAEADFRGFRLDFLSDLCPYVAPDDYSNPLVLNVEQCNRPRHVGLRQKYVRGHHDAIIVHGWGTRVGTVRPVTTEVRNALDSLNLHHVEISPSSILINIRLAEVLRDPPIHADYGPVPISFYRAMVRRLRKNPVFIGQMTESQYLDDLRLEFPDARFIDLDPTTAFETIRRAPHKIVAMSTFSWLAAWFGATDTRILMPLTGGFNPLQRQDWDLTPWNNPRFEFRWLFPLKRTLAPLETHLRNIEASSLGYPSVSRHESRRRAQLALLDKIGKLIFTLRNRRSPSSTAQGPRP